MLDHRGTKLNKPHPLSNRNNANRNGGGKRTARQRTGGGKRTLSDMPPLSLLNAWYWMWRFGSDKKTTSKGKENLLNVFKSTSDIEEYFDNI